MRPRSTAFTLLAAATVAIAWRTDAALFALPGAGLLTVIVLLHWAAPTMFEELVLPSGVAGGAIPEPPTGSGPHLALGLGLAALFGLTGFAAQGRSDRAKIALIWSATAAVAPVAILVALYARIADFDRSIPFAGLALALAALYGYATELLGRREPRPGLAASAAVFATGAVASLALALTFALEKGWLTVALALMVPGIAWIAGQRPLPALRWLAAGVIALVLLRIGYEPRIVGGDIGTTPIVNWLLYGYGVPAACFWYAGHLLRRRADDVPARMADGAAVLFTVLLAFLEIRHYMTNGDIYAPSADLTETALQVCVGLAMTIGLERLRLRSHSVVHDIGALIVAALTLGGIVFGLFLLDNPLFNTTTVGGPVFNLILLGYGIPALLAGALALIARANRPLAYRYIAASAAVALALLYLTLEVRRIYPRQHDRGLRRHRRRRAIHLFGGLARLRRRAVDRRLPAALAARAHGLGRGGRAHHRQGIPGRHGGVDRHLPRLVLHRPRRRADRNCLALPKIAIPSPARRSPGRGDVRKADGSAREAIRRGLARDAQVQ